MPSLSIIIPVYQAKDYIGKCIKSILGQSFSDFELLLVDDGSSDGSGAICRDFAKKDERVKYIYQENQGVSSARNAGLDHAAGEYITFVDADDWVENYAFQAYMDVLKKNSVDILWHGSMKDVWRDGKKKSSPKGRPAVEGEFSKESMKSYIMEQNGEIAVNVFSYVFKNELLNDITFNINMPYAEDTVFVMQALAKAKRYYLQKNCLYHYNARAGSAAYRWQPKMLDCYEKSFKEISLFYESLCLSKKQINEMMAVRAMNGYASLIYNLCLETCTLKINEKWHVVKQARKKFKIDYYKKIYKMDTDSMFEKAKTILTVCHLEIILLLFGPLYCRRI